MDFDFAGPPEHYCDSVQVTANPWSVILSLGLATERPGEQRTFAVVRMSPQHAKALNAILTNTIAAYESELGAIPMPQMHHDESGDDDEQARGEEDGD